MRNIGDRLRQATLDMPLVAILRGLVPERAQAIARILTDTGFRILEVPLNGPRALEAISEIRRVVSPNAVVGAGTVLSPSDAVAAVGAGAELLVMPNTDVRVMDEGRALGVALMPGVFTPSEAFGALQLGAHGLKLFPAEIAGPQGLKAMRSVLPPAMAAIYAVGGVAPESLRAWHEAGADGFGAGSSLFKPAYSDGDVAVRAKAFVQACAALKS